MVQPLHAQEFQASQLNQEIDISVFRVTFSLICQARQLSDFSGVIQLLSCHVKLKFFGVAVSIGAIHSAR
jgi:hypothetical protein